MRKRKKATRRKKKTSHRTIYVVRHFPKPDTYYVKKKGVLKKIEDGVPNPKKKAGQSDKKKELCFGEWFW